MKVGNNKIIMFLMLILAFVLSIFKKKVSPEVVPGIDDHQEENEMSLEKGQRFPSAIKKTKKYDGINGHIANLIYQSRKWGYLGGRGDLWRFL